MARRADGDGPFLSGGASQLAPQRRNEFALIRLFNDQMLMNRHLEQIACIAQDLRRTAADCGAKPCRQSGKQRDSKAQLEELTARNAGHK
jgi:hypothetical protein